VHYKGDKSDKVCTRLSEEDEPWYAKMLLVVLRFDGNANWIIVVVRLTTVPAISVNWKYAPGSITRPFVKLTWAIVAFIGGLIATFMSTGSVYIAIVPFTGLLEFVGMNAAEAWSVARNAGRSVANMTESGGEGARVDVLAYSVLYTPGLYALRRSRALQATSDLNIAPILRAGKPRAIFASGGSMQMPIERARWSKVNGETRITSGPARKRQKAGMKG
jgi:hypothetical protein